MTVIEVSGVLFDMDGVLVDSTPAVERVWAAWAREHGFDPDEVVKKAHGRPSITTIRDCCRTRIMLPKIVKLSGAKSPMWRA